MVSVVGLTRTFVLVLSCLVGFDHLGIATAANEASSDGSPEGSQLPTEDAAPQPMEPASNEQATPPEDAAGTALDESILAQPIDGTSESAGEKTSATQKSVTPRKRTPQAKKVEEPTVKESLPPQVMTEVPTVQIPEGSEISQGQRITIEGKGFSIVPPAGWIVQRDIHRVSLSLVLPVPEGKYPSNINVIRFPGSKLMNRETEESFGEKIVKDFPATSPTIESYSLRNSQQIDLADGRKAILYYTDFLGSGRKMMQAHILASSQSNHYLITYTDTAENFEANPEGVQPELFSLAWGSLVSLELDSPNPTPSRELSWILGIVGGIVISWFIFAFVRNRRAAAEYRQFADRGHTPSDNDELISSLAEVGVGQKVSLEPTLMSMPKSDAPISVPEVSLPRSAKDEQVRGKKIKVAKKDQKIADKSNWEDLSSKASDVSSIEFSQDKFKREI